MAFHKVRDGALVTFARSKGQGRGLGIIDKRAVRGKARSCSLFVHAFTEQTTNSCRESLRKPGTKARKHI